MTSRESHPDTRPPRRDPAEVDEDTRDERGAADPGTGDVPDDEERPADWRLYTGERLEGDKGPYRPKQMNVGRENEAGGGEWPDPDAEPEPPAPGAE